MTSKDMGAIALQLEAKSLELPKVERHHTLPIMIHAPVTQGKVSLLATQDQLFSIFWMDHRGHVHSGYIHMAPFVLERGRIRPGSFLFTYKKEFVCTVCDERVKNGLDGEPKRMVPATVANWDYAKRMRRLEKLNKGRPEDDLLTIDDVPSELSCACCRTKNIVQTGDTDHKPHVPEHAREALLEHLGREHVDEVLPEIFVVFKNGRGPDWAPKPDTLAAELARRVAADGSHIVPYDMVAGTDVSGATSVLVTAPPVTIGACRESRLYRDKEREKSGDNPDYRAYTTQFLFGHPVHRVESKEY